MAQRGGLRRLRLREAAAQAEEVVEAGEHGHEHGGVQQQRHPQGFPGHRDHGEDGGDLQAGLDLPERARGHHHAGLGGAEAQHGDGELAGDDDHRHPRGQPPEGDEREQGGDDQQLVREGVHELAEGRDGPARAREVAVREVREGGQREDDRREHVSLGSVSE